MSTPGEVGRLSAALTIDGAEQFQQKLQQVGQTFTDTAHKGTAFGRAGEAAVRTAAGATTALTAAATAYLTILMKTGVSYNSLQQNSRAALSVMLGGAEQANAQMDKLDTFARTSPFAKDVFVQAQQQLLGFGVEAQKVIPYLDAIQNAVAATGGSSARVGELSLIMSQIQSSAKITATDLREFGNRGVDAAELIGSQMGKTAAQIREDITAGALDATVALDALAAGMQEKFGGTTDLVKEQWTGATDRIKAANRDLGAVLAEPFVSHQGGGMAVTWANQIADVLRAIEKQAKPVMEILTWRGMPLFDNLTVSLDKAAASIDRFNPDKINVGLDRLAGHAPGIAALAGAVLALGANVGPLGRLFSVLGIGINPVVAAFVGLAAASPEVRGALADLLETGKPLVPVLGEVATIASGMLSTALPVVADGIGLVVSVARPLVELLAAIPAPVLLGVAAFLALNRAAQPLEGGLRLVSDGLRGLAERGAVQAALGGTTQGVGMLATVSMSAQSAVRGLGTALKVAFLSNPIGIALTVVTTAVGLWAAANAAAQQKVEEHNSRVQALQGTLNQTTGAMTEATRAQIAQNLAETEAQNLAKELGVTYRDVEAAATGNAAAQQRVTDAVQARLETYMEDGRVIGTQAMAYAHASHQAQDLTTIIGEQTAAIEAAQQAKRDAIQAEREHNAAMTDSERSSKRFTDALEVARDTTADLTTRVSALKQALDELKGGQISAEEAAKNFTRANLSLAEGLALTDENGVKLWQSMLDGSGSINESTREGLAFSDAMGQMRDRMLETTIIAADQALANNDLEGAIAAATTAAQGQIDSMRATMEAAGLEQSQIDGLIGAFGAIPEVVATMLVSEGYDKVDAQVVGVVAQLDRLSQGATLTIDSPDDPEVRQRIEELGYEINELPEGKIAIVASGEQKVRDVIAELTAPEWKNVFIRPVTTGTPEDWRAPMSAPSVFGSRLNGGFGEGDVAAAFAGGGLPSGYYRAPAGKPALYKFAEQSLPWELFISPQPGMERQNAEYALEGLRRLGFPSIPIAALGGIPHVRAFQAGGITGATSSTPTVQPVPAGGGRSAPLVGSVHFGGGATQNDFAEFESFLDYYERGL